MLFSDQEIIQLEDGELRFWPQFLDWESAQQYFEAVKNETPWEQSQITIAGRKIAIPRLNAWYGDAGADYGYSGVKLRTRAFTPQLVALRNRVEKTTECGFNSALINLYRDNNDSVDWHADDEEELGRDPIVASVSLGEPRAFELRRRNDHRKRFNIELPNGSLLLMAGTLQHFWQHRLPKQKQSCGERINITFRTVYYPAGLSP